MTDGRKFLRDMLDRATFVMKVLTEHSRSELDSDRLLRSAVEREPSIVGEALYQFHKQDPQLAERIEHWNEIIRFRHVIVHGYSVLSMDMIWDVVQKDLPSLVKQLNKMLSEPPDK